MEQFKNNLENYKATPSPDAWKHLDNKLEHRRQKRRIVRFRNISLAASFVALVAVVGMMNIYVQKYNPDLFATSKNFEPILMESLEEADDGLYDRSSLRKLNKIYSSLSR